MQETQDMWVKCLRREDSLATHSSILAWKIPWAEEPGGLQSMGSQKSDMTYQLKNNNNEILRGRPYNLSSKLQDF